VVWRLLLPRQEHLPLTVSNLWFLLLSCWSKVMSLWNWTGKLPIVHPPGNTIVNTEQRWNDTNRENRRTRRKTCPSATLSNTDPTWTALGVNPCLQGKKPAINRLSCGMTEPVGCIKSRNILTGWIIISFQETFTVK
jgi:hypothetical protein